MRPDQPRLDPITGLCLSCSHVHPIKTGRGSVFYLCGRAKTDPRFPKYPRLPVVSCTGWQALPPSGG